MAEDLGLIWDGTTEAPLPAADGAGHMSAPHLLILHAQVSWMPGDPSPTSQHTVISFPLPRHKHKGGTFPQTFDEDFT
eukprot:1136435-Pelagomonas_calceolata.AAC.12